MSFNVWRSGDIPPWTQRNLRSTSAETGRQLNDAIHASYTVELYLCKPTVLTLVQWQNLGEGGMTNIRVWTWNILSNVDIHDCPLVIWIFLATTSWAHRGTTGTSCFIVEGRDGKEGERAPRYQNSLYQHNPLRNKMLFHQFFLRLQTTSSSHTVNNNPTHQHKVNRSNLRDIVRTYCPWISPQTWKNSMIRFFLKRNNETYSSQRQ